MFKKQELPDLIIQPNELVAITILLAIYPNGYKAHIITPIKNTDSTPELIEDVIEKNEMRIKLSIFHISICDYYTYLVLKRNNDNDNVYEYVGSYLKDSKNRITHMIMKNWNENPDIQKFYTENDIDTLFVEDATFFINQFKKNNQHKATDLNDK
jgi:hypothetical protein